MNKNMLLLLSMIIVNVKTHCMTLAPNQLFYKPNPIKSDRFFALKIEKQLYENSQKIMQQLGKLPLSDAQEQISKLDFLCVAAKWSDDQKLIINTLNLAEEHRNPILFHFCDQNQKLLTKFGEKPLAKALEWFALMKEKYEKDKKLASRITFLELYTLSMDSVIELANATQHFAKHPTIPYHINSYQERILANLPVALKGDAYFYHKTFFNHKRAIYFHYDRNLDFIKVYTAFLIPSLTAEMILVQLSKGIALNTIFSARSLMKNSPILAGFIAGAVTSFNLYRYFVDKNQNTISIYQCI